MGMSFILCHGRTDSRQALIFTLLLVVFSVSAQEIFVTELHTTTAKGAWYTESVYSPIEVFNGAVYFVYVGPDMYPYVGKTQNGQTSTWRLDTNDDYTVYDDGHHHFSLGISPDGYIHVTGDMHNHPHMDAVHLPESYQESNILYWISDNPENIESFSFMGNDSTKTIPGTGFSYGSFRTDRNGKLYYISRTMALDRYWVKGGRGLGIYGYDETEKAWTAFGGLAPHSDAHHNVVIWENSGRNGGSYQMYKGDMVFDKNNRMHIVTSINHGDPAVNANYILYAYSDDGGGSFYRADGSQINSLPLRVEQGVAKGDVVEGNHDANIGQSAITIDSNNHPIIHYAMNGGTHYKYWTGTSWSSRQTSPLNTSGSTDRAKLYYNEVTRQIIFSNIGSNNILLKESVDGATTTFDVGRRLRHVSYRSLRETATIYGLMYADSDFRVLQIDFSGFELDDPVPSFKIVSSKNGIYGLGSDGDRVYFHLQNPARIDISVINLTGSIVEVLHSGSLAAGEHNYFLEQDQYSPGIYLLRIQHEDRMDLLKVMVD